jgi:hypothetical protein
MTDVQATTSLCLAGPDKKDNADVVGPNINALCVPHAAASTHTNCKTRAITLTTVLEQMHDFLGYTHIRVKNLTAVLAIVHRLL